MSQKDAPPRTPKQEIAGIDSRMAAFEILKSVDGGRYLDMAMRRAAPLEARDRAFARLLVTTCLRRGGQIDRILDTLMTRPPAGKARDALHILRIGAAQLLFLETGAHAAVNSTVELMRASGFDRLTGLANAVMRRLAREAETLLSATDVEDNLPDWLRKSWRKHYGVSQTRKMMELMMRPPTLDITPRSDAEDWADILDGELIDGRTVRRDFDGDPTRLDGFAEGHWWVQDAAAALPAALFGDLEGRHVVDLCAAPGGKTAQLIAAGAKVTAVDSSKQRLGILERNLGRLGMSATLVATDGRKFTPREKVDAVLVDAPCSATGTLRRRPDVLRHRAASDMTSLAAIQRALITRAAGWLEAGGCLIYATCSLQHEEGEAVIGQITTELKDRIAIDPVTEAEAGDFAPALTDNGTLRILPSDFASLGGVDGFFIARLRSTA